MLENEYLRDPGGNLAREPFSRPVAVVRRVFLFSRLPAGMRCSKRKTLPRFAEGLSEVATRFELVYKVLQTSA